MIFELSQDFHDAVAGMPAAHPKRRMPELLEEAIRRDIHFVARHPTTLFQCMSSSRWWHDSPEAVQHCEEPKGALVPRRAALVPVAVAARGRDTDRTPLRLTFERTASLAGSQECMSSNLALAVSHTPLKPRS